MTALGGLAHAQDGSLKDSAPPPARQFTFSANVGVTSDYVFRGFSQKNENPALQGGFDIGYGLFYAGVWGSGVDFGEDATTLQSLGRVEIDYYAGIKPTLGPVNFDLGIIYYTYPGAFDPAAETDYFEGKFGASTSFNKLTIAGTVFYSPDYTLELGPATTLEGGLSYELPAVANITPTVSGLVGTTLFSDNSALDYVYWNAGVGLGFSSNFSIDLRYWGTSEEGFCGVQNLCDDRFVATAKVALP
jgi:uncharacterized protein (TIGR02001 family)